MLIVIELNKNVFGLWEDFISPLQALKETHVQEEKSLRFLYKVEKTLPRPPTPAVDVPREVCSSYMNISFFHMSCFC